MVESSALISILAGGATALVAVFLTFYLRNQWQEIQSLRAIQAELEQNTQRLRELSELLTGDLQRQQVDLPIDVPPGTKMEIRYVVSFPSSLSTTAFEQLKHSGMFLRLSPEIRQSLFEVYDTIDRINRLREHRERVHFDDAGNVHIVIDPSGLDVEPGTTIGEADLSDETRRQLAALRRMRRAMKEVNHSILALIGSIAPPTVRDDLERESFLPGDSEQNPDVDPSESERIDLEELRSILRDVERQSVWARFM